MLWKGWKGTTPPWPSRTWWSSSHWASVGPSAPRRRHPWGGTAWEDGPCPRESEVLTRHLSNSAGGCREVGAGLLLSCNRTSRARWAPRRHGDQAPQSPLLPSMACCFPVTDGWWPWVSVFLAERRGSVPPALTSPWPGTCPTAPAAGSLGCVVLWRDIWAPSSSPRLTLEESWRGHPGRASADLTTMIVPSTALGHFGSVIANGSANGRVSQRDAAAGAGFGLTAVC